MNSSIKNNPAYNQALVNLLAEEVAKSRIGNEESDAYDAAEHAVSTAWDALAAVVDAWAARQ